MSPLINRIMNGTVDLTLVTSPTTTAANADVFIPSTTVLVAVCLSVGYPLFMVIVVYLCKKYMYSYGPYAGLSYDDVSIIMMYY